MTPEAVDGVEHIDELLARAEELNVISPERRQELREQMRSGQSLIFEKITPEGRQVEIRQNPLPEGGIVRTYADVTASRKAQVALKQAEERWRSVVQNAPDIILTVDRQGMITSANHLPGRGAGDKLLGLNIFDYLPDPGHSEMMRKSLERVFHQGHAAYLEVIALNSRGEPVWYETRMSPLRCDGGVEAAVLVSRDISGRKALESRLEASRRELENRVLERTRLYKKANEQLLEEIESRSRAEKALRQSEERYRAMFHTNQAVKLLIDAETGEIVEANRAACEFYGYAPEEMAGLEIWRINTLPREEVLENMRKALERQKTCFEFTHRLKDGSLRDVDVFTGPLEVDGRRLLFSIVQDVTDRNSYQAELKDSRRRYSALFDNAGDAIVVRDLQDEILDANRVACERFGKQREELVGRKVPALMPLGFSKLSAFIREELLDKGEACFETVQELPDGRELPIEVNSRVIPYLDGAAVLSIARDISERKQAENRLNLLAAKLLSAQEEERKRIGIDLHDGLCQNLTAIKVHLEGKIRYLAQKLPPKDTEDLKQAVDFLRHSLAEARRIIMNLRPTVLDDMGLEAAVLWLCKETGKVYPGMDIQAEIDLDEEDCPDDLKIVLFRIIQEALNNAARHSKADMVEIRLRKVRDEAVLDVSDNGVGFDSLDHPSGGVGLQGIEERLQPFGGVLEIETRPGEGLRLRALLPLRLAAV
jgi:PAS domain S-box-containing protein